MKLKNLCEDKIAAEYEDCQEKQVQVPEEDNRPYQSQRYNAFKCMAPLNMTEVNEMDD